MNIIKFLPYRTQLGLYYNIVESDDLLYNLGCLFAHEIGGQKDSSWINFLNDSTYQKMSGNEVILEKKGSDIYISNLYDEDSDGTYNKLKISVSQLLKLIRIWENLLDKESKEIWLIRDGDQFELIEGTFLKNS
jgi:hypothetical protein